MLAPPLGFHMAQATQTYSAASTILARVGVTLVDFNLTVGACVPRSARTCVAPLSCVGACGTVLAGLVVGAVVQVCNRGQSRHLLACKASIGWGSSKEPLALCVVKQTLRQGLRTHPDCRKGHPSLPGSCTATAADRYHEGSPGTGCTHHSIGLANPLCIWKKKTNNSQI